MMLVTISISKGNLIYVTHITPLKAVILFKILLYVAYAASLQTTQ